MQLTKRRIIPIGIAMAVLLAALFIFMPKTANAYEVGAFTLTATDGGELTLGIDYSYDEDSQTLTILSDKAITIKNTLNEPTEDRIVVAKDVPANITLAGIEIEVSQDTGACTFKIEDDSTANVNITLADGTENKLLNGGGCAALQKNVSISNAGTLTIDGTGYLEAISYNGAGIGGGENANTSNIIINNGVFIAGSGYGAGIGGGSNGSGSNITINGGAVVALSEFTGAGIGGGNSGSGSNITINGGTIRAACNGSKGAGIGGGSNGSGSDIFINGGSVYTLNSAKTDMIGGGEGMAAVTPKNSENAEVYFVKIANPDSKIVTIDDKGYTPVNHKEANFYYEASYNDYLYLYLTGEHHTITVGETTTEYYFNDDTKEFVAAGTEFTVSGGEFFKDYIYREGVLTVLSDKALTIANADPDTATTDQIVVKKDVSANITLAGVNIDCSTLNYTCAFLIEDDSTGNVNITLAEGSENTLKSGVHCASLQKNGSGAGIGTLTIDGTGLLRATSKQYGAAIGSGSKFKTSNIVINGGTIIATGGPYAAGIGGNFFGDASNITINGGTVTATSVSVGAAIGAGSDADASDIFINGGSVKTIFPKGCNAFGGGKGRGAVTPKNSSNEEVYPLTIKNPDGKAVIIDNGDEYTPVNHTAADPNDDNLYLYLTGKNHTVKVSDTISEYCFDDDQKELWRQGSEFTISGGTGGTDYIYRNDLLTVLTDTQLTIANVDQKTPTTDRIVVKKNISANITLNGVNIDVSNNNDMCAFQIEDNSTGSVTITLGDNSKNILKSGNNCAGLQKNGTSGSLLIQGTGSLITDGGRAGAGIGGGVRENAANITISSGTISAIGSISGAGIGGGYMGAGSNITINGGSIKAAAGEYANAIGGGEDNPAVTPKNLSNEEVYLLTIENPDGKAVAIDNVDYAPVNHKAADPEDGNLYLYLKGEHHTVKVGDTTTEYYFDDDKNEFWTPGTEFTIFGGKFLTDYIYRDGVLTVLTDAELTIANADPATATTDQIVVKKNVSANITLAGVNINVMESINVCAFKIEDNSTGNVKITLAENSDNKLISGAYCAGLQKNGPNGSLLIQGTGSLLAFGGNGSAGIGSGKRSLASNEGISYDDIGKCTNITINSGNIYAEGGDSAAGIGGGDGCDCLDITINGGTVIAVGGHYGAGIGGGYNGSGSNITINGGTVTAFGNDFSAGIGGGDKKNGSNISINGGSVMAEGLYAIGGGISNSAVTPTNSSNNNVYLLTIKNPDSKDVTIDKVGYSPVNHMDLPSEINNLYFEDYIRECLYVYLTGEHHTVAIGETTTEYYFDDDKKEFWTPGTEFTVTGGKFLTDYTYRDGVLTVLTGTELTIANADPDTPTTDTIVVKKDVSANITLAGVNIDVSGTDYACAFLIEDDSTGNVNIMLAEGTENFLKSGDYCAGLQKNGIAAEILTIKGSGSLEASGGFDSAGIGGGDHKNASNIVINSGTIKATGGKNSSSIGGGYKGSGSNITINGGTVIALGRKNSAAIGGGDSGNGSNISITGGTVTAAGTDWGPGIGGGSNATASDIKISGGSVKVTASDYANTIGGGYGSPATTPTNSAGDAVYPLVVKNPDGNAVKIDDTDYTPVNHKAADPDDGNLYLYLTGVDHTVTVGDITTRYCFDSDQKVFWVLGSAFTITGGTNGTDYTYRDGVLTVLTGAELTIANVNPSESTTDRIVVAKDVSANITLDNVFIAANDGEPAFGIADDSSGNVTVTIAADSENMLKGGSTCAGLQKNGENGSLLIQGTGSLEAVGGENGAGIGSGFNATSSYITITGGTVVATGYDGGAGIGGGTEGTGSDITISGGTVTAEGGSEGGAGIGGGMLYPGVNIVISGGSVKATAHGKADPIGHGSGKTENKPTDGNGSEVYLFTISNPNGSAVKIDGKAYAPVNHKAADPADGNLYVYLTGKNHTVEVGGAKTLYHFNEDTEEFVKCAVRTGSDNYESDGETHWHTCWYDDCDVRFDEEAHVSSGKATETIPETCTICGYVITPELGHKHTDHLTLVPAKAATCTENGSIEYFKCSCGKFFTDKTAKTETTLASVTIKATGHKFGAWVITKPATTTSTGIQTRTCTVCGDTEEDTIPKKSGGSSGGSTGGSSGGGSSRPSAPAETKPSINGIQKSWADIAADIAKLHEGGTAVINMNGETTVPADVIRAIKESGAKMELIVDSTRSWIADGSKISTVSTADFSIISGNADKSALRGVIGADFKINDVGVPADLKLTFRKAFAGQFANLYKLTDGRLEFQNCAKVDENGIAILSGANAKGEYIAMVCEFSDIPGDINNDGVLNALDASAILKNVIGTEIGINPLVADFNADGTVNALDASAILKRIVAA